MGRTHALVDVQAIRRAADLHHAGTKLMKDLGSDLIGRAMGPVHHDLQTAQRQAVIEGAFAELDVATGCIGQAPCLAQRGGVHPDGGLP